VYAALGNHDSYNQSVFPPVVLSPSFKQTIPERKMRLIRSVGPLLTSSAGVYQFVGMRCNCTVLSFRNYNHVASLWKHEKWLPEAAVQLTRSHYSAYMVKRSDGLRIISLNTDMCEFILGGCCPTIIHNPQGTGMDPPCSPSRTLHLLV